MVHDFIEERGLRLDGLLYRLAVWHKYGVLLHVVVVAVMSRVAELPAEERDEKHAVQDPAHSGVDIEMSRK